MKSELDVDTRNLRYRDREFVYSFNYEQNLLLRYLLDKIIEDLPDIADEYMNIYDLKTAMNNFEIREVKND